MWTKLKRGLWLLSSLEASLILLSLLFIIVLVGTFAQIYHGIYYVQKVFFQSIFIWADFASVSLPVFPGGGLVGTVLVISLSLSTALRLRWNWRNSGLIIIHVGLIILLVGAGLTSLVSEESQLYLEEGDQSFYSEHLYKSDLIIFDTSKAKSDLVTAVPVSLLKQKKRIKADSLPFDITVHQFFDNAKLSSSTDKDYQNSRINEGIGKHLSILPLKAFTKDDKRNNPTAIISFESDTQQTGRFLFALDIKGAQKFSMNGKSYYALIQPKRFYFPFFVELKKFTREYYPASNIPKEYSSLVKIKEFNPPSTREVLIYMNHPLRHKGHTFYQASFGEKTPSSVLQVVRNPSWYFPYFSSCLIAFGMILHFMIRLAAFRRRHENNT